MPAARARAGHRRSGRSPPSTATPRSAARGCSRTRSRADPSSGVAAGVRGAGGCGGQRERASAPRRRAAPPADAGAGVYGTSRCSRAGARARARARLAHGALLEREADRGGRALRGGARRRGRALSQPDDAAIVAEVGVAQLRVAVEPERADHRVVEGAREEVGQEVAARLARERLADRAGGEDLVAVLALQARDGGPVERPVERAVGAAIAVGDRQRRSAARATRASSATAGAIRSGRLCSVASSGCTSSAHPRRFAIARTCTASAPQATTPTRVGAPALIRGTPAGR